MAKSKKTGTNEPLRYAERAQKVIGDLLRGRVGEWVARKTIDDSLRRERVFTEKMRPASARVEISKALRRAERELATEGFAVLKDYAKGVMAVITLDGAALRDYVSTPPAIMQRGKHGFKELEDLVADVSKIPIPPEAVILVETRVNRWMPYTIYQDHLAFKGDEEFQSLEDGLASMEDGNRAIYVCRLRHVELLHAPVSPSSSSSKV